MAQASFSFALSSEVLATLTGVETALKTAENISDPSARWVYLTQHVLTPAIPFSTHLALYTANYASLDDPSLGPMWMPDGKESNIGNAMKESGMETFKEFYNWSVKEYEAFWDYSIKKTGIVLNEKYSAVFGKLGEQNRENFLKTPAYLQGAKMNIVDSIFNKNKGSNDAAIIYSYESNSKITHRMSWIELENLTNRVAYSVKNKLGLSKGDSVGICMQMTPESVAIYLGVIKAGCAIISIADSFASDEIDLRLKLGNAKACFTQDLIVRNDKSLEIYGRVVKTSVKTIVVLPGTPSSENNPANTVSNLDPSVKLRESDHSWVDFLDSSSNSFDSVSCDPEDVCNILFSSGTTGEPKVIPWYHCTPIKAIVDGYYHLDVNSNDVICWPTNLGWMMGPWVLSQITNGATLALFVGSSGTKEFCEWVEQVGITLLGTIPSLVKSWQNQNGDWNWSKIRIFASTGESSSPESMLWLSSRAGYKPIMEYCGGTEVAGAYMTSTLLSPNIPSSFSTPALGSGLMLLDNDGREATEHIGELALIPPTMGLSTRLLNRNHDEVYYDGMPSPNGILLRRHGDELQLLSNGYYRALGRCDDTMNLGGIKISSIEIERVCNRVTDVVETAAIAVSSYGPSILVLYVTVSSKLKSYFETKPEEAKKGLKSSLQKSIKDFLNPLFGIGDVVITDSLPRTSSNKIMRRVLRDQYVEMHGILDRRTSGVVKATS